MIKKIIFGICVFFGLVSCEKYQYDLYDKDYNPFFRTQWSAIEEDGTLVRDNLILFDFDLYDKNSLSLYMSYSESLSDEHTTVKREHFTSQSYEAKRVADETWVIDNFYINEEYCRIVLHIIDLYGNPDYANVTIYQDRFIIKEFVIVKNANILDINTYVGGYGNDSYSPSPM